jgi:hypothetical protein
VRLSEVQPHGVIAEVEIPLPSSENFQ